MTRAHGAAEAAFGPLTYHSPERAVARVDGREVLVLFEAVSRSRGNDGSVRVPFSLIHLSVPLPRPLPILFMVENRKIYVHMGSTPEVRTGDAAFDARYFLFGSPPDVVAAAFDAETRAWIGSMGDHPAVGLEGDRLGSRWSVPGDGSSVTPDDLLRAARAQLRLCDALVAAYDGIHYRLHQERGPAAADAWHANNIAQVARREQDRKRLRLIVFGALGLGLLGVVALVVLVVVLIGVLG